MDAFGGTGCLLHSEADTGDWPADGAGLCGDRSGGNVAGVEERIKYQESSIRNQES